MKRIGEIKGAVDRLNGVDSVEKVDWEINWGKMKKSVSRSPFRGQGVNKNPPFCGGTFYAVGFGYFMIEQK